MWCSNQIASCEQETSHTAIKWWTKKARRLKHYAEDWTRKNGLAKNCQDFCERAVCVSELANWHCEVPELQMSSKIVLGPLWVFKICECLFLGIRKLWEGRADQTFSKILRMGFKFWYVTPTNFYKGRVRCRVKATYVIINFVPNMTGHPMSMLHAPCHALCIRSFRWSLTSTNSCVISGEQEWEAIATVLLSPLHNLPGTMIDANVDFSSQHDAFCNLISPVKECLLTNNAHPLLLAQFPV